MRSRVGIPQPAGDGSARVRIGANDPDLVALSRAECWELYVLLGGAAPFVRNQLSVARNGGNAGIALTDDDERREVLAALAIGNLSSGLESLRLALTELAGG